MRTRKRIGADRLRFTAQLAAVTAYRAALKAGRLGSVHAEVIDEAFGIAADEMLSRANIERRHGRGIVGVLLLDLAGWAIALYAGAQADSLLIMGFKGLAVYLGIAMIIRFESAGTWRSAAKLLTPRAPAAPETARSPEQITPV